MPAWLNTEHPKLRVVRHEDYIPKEYLPTFNSNVIEIYLHRIPDLAEHFVLFNDDMFLTRPVKPEEFFVRGKARDAFLLDSAIAPDPRDIFPHMMLNNAKVINKHFEKSDVVRRQFMKIFRPSYGSGLIRNLLLTPMSQFTGFRSLHLPYSHTLSNYREVWEAEEELLTEMSGHRFRDMRDVTHYLFSDWRICKGDFVPRDVKWGRHYELMWADIREITETITRGKYAAVCLNDSSDTLEFEKIAKELRRAWEKALPEKSSFEKR